MGAIRIPGRKEYFIQFVQFSFDIFLAQKIKKIQESEGTEVFHQRRHQQDSHGPKQICKYCGCTFKKSFLPVHQRNSCKKLPDRADDKVDEEEEESDPGDEEVELMGSKLLQMIESD